MRQSRAPSSGLDKFFAAQFSAGYITSMSGFDLRQAQHTANILALRPHEAVGMLCTQDVMMQIGYPLATRDRHIQEFYAVVEVH